MVRKEFEEMKKKHIILPPTGKSRPMTIIPLVERCSCGNSVDNHHFLCDKCWGKRAKKLSELKKQEEEKEKEEREMRRLLKEKNKKYTFTIVTNSKFGLIHLLDSIVGSQKEYKYQIEMNGNSKILLNELSSQMENVKKGGRE